ncbi:uncharacterized protein LOC118349215 [Juglans regia]|uniref:Uncharacterized protein LOC118349215 n=1 Tax=Juglans regia TaxID=51240 RepID=A0A6P9EMP8_JUGRE|nr:uncharacterized protein LOC118349215 [Juglans regia]
MTMDTQVVAPTPEDATETNEAEKEPEVMRPELKKHKFGDPGSLHISIMIAESRIGRALLDWGSSVKLLLFSVYEQLGLGELKNTSIKLQLPERSVKQLATTIYQAPVILGCPFLATFNALINCRSGVLKLTFGNMTLEMNVFNTCKMHGDCDESDVHAVEVISELKEIKREAYDNSRLANERMKALHDKKILDKHLVPD